MSSDPESLLKLPRAYSLPYEWGHFSVTEDAHLAYGLVPLTANIISGGGIDKSKMPPNAVEIILASPYEDPSWEKFDSEPADGFTTQIFVSQAHITAKRGLQIAVSFQKTRDQMVKAELEKKAHEIGIGLDLLYLRSKALNNIDPRVEIEPEISKTLIHGAHKGLLPAISLGMQRRRGKIARLSPLSNVRSIQEAQTIADDVHNDLCPEYFEQKFNQSLQSI
jgi:hypothetical protein